ncbi:hypothetical protein Tco_1336558 [Tanacetum coccineum]
MRTQGCGCGEARYLKGQSKLGLWYPRDSLFDLEAFSDSDYTRASLDKKSTIGGCQFLGKRLISWKCKKQTIVTNSTTEAEYVAAANYCGQAVVISKSSVRSDLLFNDEDGIACLTKDEIFENLALMDMTGDNVERAITTDASLVAAQDSDNILKTQSTTRPETVSKTSRDPPLSEVNTFGRGDDSMEYHDDLTDFVPPTPYASPLSVGNTPRSNEGRMELIQELMETCTSLTTRVLALEEAKTAQDRVITRLKLRVKRLEKKRKARTPQPMKRRLFKGRVESSDDDLDEEDASKQGRESDKTKSMFQDSDFDVLDDDMEDVEGETVHTATTGVSVVSAPVTTTGVAISTAEPRTPPTTAATAFIDEDLTIAQTLIKMKEEKAKEKGVAIKDVEDSPRPIRSITTLQPLPTIDPKDKGKGVLVEEEPEKPEKVKRRDQGLAQIESDAELAQRLHEEELAELDRAQKERQKQEEATSAALAEEFDEIQARIDADHELAVRLTHEEQEKYTIKERVEAIRNKPPTRTQIKNMMITYLKYMGKYTHQQLKHKNFEEVKKLYEREKKWIDYFKPIDDDSQQQADGSSKNYKIFSEMLDDFDIQDVIDLHRLVNERYDTTSPEGYNLLLWGDMKTLFEPNEEDEI